MLERCPIVTWHPKLRNINSFVWNCKGRAFCSCKKKLASRAFNYHNRVSKKHFLPIMKFE